MGHATETAFAEGFDLWPYTRPYGLLAGSVFRGRFVQIFNGGPVLYLDYDYGSAGRSSVSSGQRARHYRQLQDGVSVEIEKYNAKPMKNLPPDELITFKAKTDGRAILSRRLPDPGWWGVTGVIRDTENSGKNHHSSPSHNNVGPRGRKEMTLFAVHISDGVLTMPWLAAGIRVGGAARLARGLAHPR